MLGRIANTPLLLPGFLNREAVEGCFFAQNPANQHEFLLLVKCSVLAGHVDDEVKHLV